jgi:hypothetical protein
MTIQREARTNLTQRQAQSRFNEAVAKAGVVAQMIEQDDGRWTVLIFFDDSGAPVATSELASFSDQLAEALAPAAMPAAARAAAPPKPKPKRGGAAAATLTPAAPATAAAAATPAGAPAATPKLGSLSARFESNGKPGAIGHDSTGGFSYGAYQIATKTGTMATFLSFLGKQFPALASPLTAAGGAAGASAGTDAFTTAWRTLASTQAMAFFDAQHGFIEETHYKPFAAKLLKDLGLDLAKRSAALRDVAWSTAVQHGGANSVFKNALTGKVAAQLSDAQIADAVYAERSKVEKYFPSSTPQVKAALVKRFAEELARVRTQFA